MIRPISELATYTFCASAADPHWTPPIVPPRPTRVCQRISPLLSGSRAWTMPDFCPATSARLPFARLTRIGEEEKSKSGPLTLGQLVLYGNRHADASA